MQGKKYSFTPFLHHRVGEGRGAGDRDCVLQQVRKVISYDRKGISSYGPVTRDKKGISNILDTISNHCCIYFLKNSTTQNSRPWGLPGIYSLCYCNQVHSLPDASVGFVLLISFLWGREYFLVCVFTEIRARALQPWVISLADILITIPKRFI